jgi:methyl-accepting chemotaxis protein
MTIKKQLFALTGLSIFALIAIVAVTEISNLKLIKFEKTLIEVKDLEVSLLQMNRIEYEFLENPQTENLEEFRGEYAKFQNLSSLLTSDLTELNIVVEQLPILKKRHYALP